MTLTVASLCSGIEATSLGLHLAGLQHRLAYVADNDPAAAKVLAHHHPDVPNPGNISTADWATVERVSLMHMGFPCTDLSCAGGRAGLGVNSRSGVWANCAQAISATRPPLALIENVPGLLSTPANRSTDAPDSDLEPAPTGVGDGPGGPVLRALGAVLGDLADLGYDTVWVRVSAASVGAPHLRHRIFVLAWDTAAEDRVRNILASIAGPATNPGSVEHRDGGQAGGEGPATAPVRGAVRPDGLSLLPTPAACLSERWGQPNAQTAKRRMYEEGRRNLDDAIALLPTPAARDSGRGSGYTDQPGRPLSETILRVAPPDPAVALLSTPVAHDTGRSPDAHLTMRTSIGSSSVTSLAVAAALLPTPTVADSRGTRNATSGRTDPRGSTNTNGWTLVDVAFTDRWGEYAPAIARWEILLGRPAPNPTKPGRTGRPRLSARFVEWLQGLPDGYVTSLVGSNDALRLLGNSNPPQQYAAAWRQLTATVGQLLMSKDAA
jgi:DNA (cytosine-5)-methyltransferase 1